MNFDEMDKAFYTQWERNRKASDEWYKEHKAEITEYREAHKEERKAQLAEWLRHKSATNPNYHLRVTLRNQLRQSLKSFLKGKVTRIAATEDLGCTIAFLKEHLEKQFQSGMTWDNWTNNGWHIDHIKPLDSFDLTDPEQRRLAFHYTNLRPMWAEENIRKGGQLQINQAATRAQRLEMKAKVERVLGHTVPATWF